MPLIHDIVLVSDVANREAQSIFCLFIPHLYSTYYVLSLLSWKNTSLSEFQSRPKHFLSASRHSKSPFAVRESK